MGGNRGFCGIVLLRSPVIAPRCADVRGTAVGDLWRADQGTTGHRCQRTGVFRGCMDDASKSLHTVIEPAPVRVPGGGLSLCGRCGDWVAERVGLLGAARLP